MRNIKQIKDLKGKKVIVRVDFNVPIKNGKVEDSFRIKKSLPTIKYLTERGAKVILISHLGKGEESLMPVARELNKFIKVKFVPDMIGLVVTLAIENMKNGEVILLENLRKEVWEQAGDKGYAKTFRIWGDIYVNDAFSVCHRRDMSVVVLPKFLPAYAGLQLEEERKNLRRVFKNPKHPFLFILGGAKFQTKVPLIKKYLKSADHIFIGGALAHDFFEAKGYEVGKSLKSGNNYETVKILRNKKIFLPTDVLVLSGGKLVNKKVENIYAEDNIIDVGSESVKALEEMVKKAKFILWNGPLGKYEDRGEKATKKVLKLVAASKAESILGRGYSIFNFKNETRRQILFCLYWRRSYIRISSSRHVARN